jgi:3-oxoacyl-[acyl-carrier protein] reductase
LAPSRPSEFIRSAANQEAGAGKENFRKVIDISSIAGLFGNAGQANYGAAKAGIIGLTGTMCKEWGRYRVNVNAVAFGFINTRLTESAADGRATIDVEGKQIKVEVNPDLLKTLDQRVPVGRGGRPEKAAGAAYLFCIPESNYISGQVLVCGGGLLI